MIGVGCVMAASLFGALFFLGILVAQRAGVSVWIGMAAGVVSWLAVMAGYMCYLTILDWWDKGKYPNREGIPAWGIAATWIFFAAAAVGAVGLWRVVGGAG